MGSDSERQVVDLIKLVGKQLRVQHEDESLTEDYDENRFTVQYAIRDGKKIIVKVFVG